MLDGWLFNIAQLAAAYNPSLWFVTCTTDRVALPYTTFITTMGDLRTGSQDVLSAACAQWILIGFGM